MSMDKVKHSLINEEPLTEVPNTTTRDNSSEDRKNQNGSGYTEVAYTLRTKFYAIFRLAYRWLRLGSDDESEETRAYHYWPGRNVFFFRGRLICGPDPKGLILTTTSIIISSSIFTSNVGLGLPNYSIIIVTFSTILTSIVLVNLLLVSSIDPGIIPRNYQESVEEAGTSNGVRRKRITVNGIEIKLKYCRVCKIFRPPRSCHCAVCDNCVDKFDHHCPWIGQCVALRNYRFYLTFIFSALIFFVYIFTFTYIRLHQIIKQNGPGMLRLLRSCPETLSLALFSVPAIGFLGGLAIFHVYLVVINQTACENFRQRYVGRKNPYDEGILKNIKEALCMPLPSSRVDFRAELAVKSHAISTRNG